MTAPSHTAASVASTSRLVARGLTDTSSPPHPLSLSRSTRLRRRLARGLRPSDESSALSERSESKGSGLQGTRLGYRPAWAVDKSIRDWLYGGVATPASVTMAVMRWWGVMSNAGFAAAMA